MRQILALLLIFTVCIALWVGCEGPVKEAQLIPRKVFFDNPDKANVQLSSDGKNISFLAPLNNVLNVWVAPADNPSAAQAVTADSGRGIRIYFWAYTNQHIVYLQDDGGDENWALHVVDVSTKEDRNLTPFSEILDEKGQPIILPSGKKLRPTARIYSVCEKFPSEILIGLNNRNPQFHDVHRLNIETGEMTLLLKNEGFAGFIMDDDYQIRFGMRQTPEGGSEYLKMTQPNQWEPFLKISMEDMMTTALAGFDKSGSKVYMIDSRERNTAALKIMDLQTGEVTLLAEDPRSDIQGAIVHPTEKNVQAVSVNYLKSEWKVLDPAIQADMDYLKTVSDGDMSVNTRTLDDKNWIVIYVVDNGPVRYYLYNRPEKKATFLFTNRKSLEGLPLVKMHPVVIKSRDGMDLVSYLSLPHGVNKNDEPKPTTPQPMVMVVHGGPWARDEWGYDGMHQWLANRGYAVLSVNFRGSTGFGKNFINAGNLEWAAKMHDDLIDAVNWAVAEGIAPKDKIAIMGGSYGGYATLVGLTFTPDVFACGVDIVGPSNLQTLLNTIPPYWKPIFEMFAKRVGDPRTEDGIKLLTERSPLTFADKIQKPLLIGQGANDPRVKQAEADQIVKAMQEKSIPVTYVLYSDEGHGFARPENSLSFYAVTDLFLAQHLGGVAEPIGEDFNNSTIAVPTGAEQVPGLKEALDKK
ncbi:S9 family peptidase [candidate division KSB1 bacterium]|nr:S9 family peptidase [candidate division KSB1 bacterium]